MPQSIYPVREGNQSRDDSRRFLSYMKQYKSLISPSSFQLHLIIYIKKKKDEKREMKSIIVLYPISNDMTKKNQ